MTSSRLPLALIYSCLIRNRKPNIQHCYFSVCGLAITYYMYGAESIHCLVNILLDYILLKVCGGTLISVILAFVMNMSYLSYGYYNKSKDQYDVTWTLVHCILTLKLTAVVFDCYDGARDKQKLEDFQKENRLERIPTLLELLGLSYFFGSVIIGPQINMKRYLSFVSGELINPKDDRFSEKLKYGVYRILGGSIYLILYGIFFPKFHYKLILTPGFQEGSCIMTGISYNPSAVKVGYDKWSSLANCHPWPFETECTLQSLIHNFNITTNDWMVRYVYKRLKFLGSKILCHFGSLAFISLWHGFYAGYYLNFAWEFITVLLEKQAGNVFSTIYGAPFYQSHPLLKLALFPLAYFMRHMILAFGMMVFTLLRLDWCLQAYKVFGYANFYCVVYWIIFYTTFRVFKSRLFPSSRRNIKTGKAEE
ncbi:uncharacterized protein TRIADDRAFT_57452 [Trichoplax adhaerens]|uniref:Lysophospholipid acyltransferase 5 n=1 Tax=Trichoplax adhaerens TaxID=10228 RepID=B3RZH3_TRIAD|nr:hypothetical protein TRIADDRAFT_57452 [Trichoplax adhaerens]EDV23840.1 hypothetical protein TRIADDRAFT_57452 [Trichoplax adhaerens]|eukprot:XP_002113366.1 hypothetical protein TRIADDRAFT_57452 [Trichoplax adhaerens]